MADPIILTDEQIGAWTSAHDRQIFTATEPAPGMYFGQVTQAESMIPTAAVIAKLREVRDACPQWPDAPTLAGWMREATHDFWESDGEIGDGDEVIDYVAAAVLAKLAAQGAE